VIDHGLVEQPLVPLLQRRQQHVAIDVAGQPLQFGHHPIDHLARRCHAVREQTAQAEAFALGATESDRSVERLVAEYVEAALPHGDPRSAWTMATTTGPHTVSRMLPIA